MTDTNSHVLRVILFVATAVLLCLTSSPATLAQGSEFDDVYAMPLTVTSPLPFLKTPMAPMIDFDALIKQAGLNGVLNPNSIHVVDTKTGSVVPYALSEHFAYGNAGQV